MCSENDNWVASASGLDSVDTGKGQLLKNRFPTDRAARRIGIVLRHNVFFQIEIDRLRSSHFISHPWHRCYPRLNVFPIFGYEIRDRVGGRGTYIWIDFTVRRRWQRMRPSFTAGCLGNEFAYNEFVLSAARLGMILEVVRRGRYGDSKSGLGQIPLLVQTPFLSIARNARGLHKTEISGIG